MESTSTHPTYTIVKDPKEADAVGWGFYTNDITKPSKIYFKFPQIKADEIRIKTHYAGLCFTEVHTVKEDLGPVSNKPIIPGHEIVGEVTLIGKDVKGFKVGELVGFGCFRENCGSCKQCKRGDDNICKGYNGQKYTYGGPNQYWGGYATAVQHPAKWFYKLPSKLDISKAAPLFCAGITLFHPIQKYARKGDNVAVIGLGGLGHLGLRYAKAWGCNVTAFTTSKDKIDLCKKLGADEVVITSETDAWKTQAGKFDLVINTISEVNQALFDNILSILDDGGVAVQLGLGTDKVDFRPAQLTFGQKTIAGSLVGSKKATIEMLEFSAKNNIEPMCEEFEFDDFPKAWDTLINGRPKFRCVLKTKNGK